MKVYILINKKWILIRKLNRPSNWNRNVSLSGVRLNFMTKRILLELRIVGARLVFVLIFCLNFSCDFSSMPDNLIITKVLLYKTVRDCNTISFVIIVVRFSYGTNYTISVHETCTYMCLWNATTYWDVKHVPNYLMEREKTSFEIVDV